MYCTVTTLLTLSKGELSILGVQANKLHLVIWNWYWTKLDIATSWKTKQNCFHFLTCEPVEKNWPPWFFPIFTGNHQKFLEENKVFLKASICDVLMVESLLGVDPTQEEQKWMKDDMVICSIWSRNLRQEQERGEPWTELCGTELCRGI